MSSESTLTCTKCQSTDVRTWTFNNFPRARCKRCGHFGGHRQFKQTGSVPASTSRAVGAAFAYYGG
jgi:Zn ribbon nucleic-acid-binding protein